MEAWRPGGSGLEALARSPWPGGPGLGALVWGPWPSSPCLGPWPGGPGPEPWTGDPGSEALTYRQTYKWTYRRTDRQNIPCILQDIVPLSLLPKNLPQKKGKKTVVEAAATLPSRWFSSSFPYLKSRFASQQWKDEKKGERMKRNRANSLSSSFHQLEEQKGLYHDLRQCIRVKCIM